MSEIREPLQDIAHLGHVELLLEVLRGMGWGREGGSGRGREGGSGREDEGRKGAGRGRGGPREFTE